LEGIILTKKLNPFGGNRKGEWETPPELFKKIDEEFHFTLDVCADSSNTKCSKFITKEQDAEKLQSWEGEICWMNPPYYECGKWIKRAYEESRKDNTIVVCLVPPSTDTKWFHKYCVLGEVRFLNRRVQFLENKVPVQGNPKGSMVVIFGKNIQPKMMCWDLKW
jgi:phage N-6-adenine-methyltransferase